MRTVRSRGPMFLTRRQPDLARRTGIHRHDPEPDN
jgi:hypothetical protein